MLAGISGKKPWGVTPQDPLVSQGCAGYTFYSVLPSDRVGFPEGCCSRGVAYVASCECTLSHCVSLPCVLSHQRCAPPSLAPAWTSRCLLCADALTEVTSQAVPCWPALLSTSFRLPLDPCHLQRPVSWRVSCERHLEPYLGLDALWGPFLKGCLMRTRSVWTVLPHTPEV